VNTRPDLADQIVALLPRLRRFALALTRHADDGDDLVQSTVERALTRLDKWSDGTRLDSWLFRMMQNLWIDQVRARRIRGAAPADFDTTTIPGADGRDTVESRLILQDTLKAVMALPDDQRAVMVLVVVEGFAYRDAAEVLDIPIGTVMSRLARARAALDLSLEKRPGADSEIRQ
jgi:RNA polymerase sigma-70 factor (ECF subfamily)